MACSHIVSIYAEIENLTCLTHSLFLKSHQYVQAKLIDGRPARWKQGSEAIVPQKYTPLESQIVKLKEENPGVLLIVEVRHSFSSEIAHHLLHTLESWREQYSLVIMYLSVHMLITSLVL